MYYVKKTVRMENYLFKTIEIFSKYSNESSATKYLEKYVFLNVSEEEFIEIEKEVKKIEKRNKGKIDRIAELGRRNGWDLNEIFDNPFRKRPLGKTTREDIYICSSCRNLFSEKQIDGVIACENCGAMSFKTKPYNFRIEKGTLKQYENLIEKFSKGAVIPSLNLTRILKIMIIYHIYKFEEKIGYGIF